MSLFQQLKKQTQQKKEEITVTSQEFNQLQLPAIPTHDPFNNNASVSTEQDLYIRGAEIKFPDVPDNEPPEESDSSSSSGRASPRAPNIDTLKDLVTEPYLTLTGTDRDIDDVYKQIGAIDLSDFAPPPAAENGNQVQPPSGAASSGASSTSNSSLLVQPKRVQYT